MCQEWHNTAPRYRPYLHYGPSERKIRSNENAKQLICSNIQERTRNYSRIVNKLSWSLVMMNVVLYLLEQDVTVARTTCFTLWLQQKNTFLTINGAAVW